MTTKDKNEYVRRNYDRINITIKKGLKEQIGIHYKLKGYKSLNDYINKLIAKDMELL